jgi:hypothetical protein
MIHLKHADLQSVKAIDETSFEAVNHRTLQFEKRIMALETETARLKVQVEHELP